jgi:PTH1 family peptidyl-tRNA hydrolase
MHMVVGLGNPGARYARTRHNAGFLVASRVAERAGTAADRKQFGALVADVPVRGRRVTVVLPQGYMNVSGQPVASIAGYYKVPPTDTIVVHDDMDLPFGRLRVRVGGSHAGHNGVRDIQRVLGTEFVRVRVGVGRPPEGWDPADYVLANWTAEESAGLDAVVDRAADAVETVVGDGVAVAMNRFNAAPAAST